MSLEAPFISADCRSGTEKKEVKSKSLGYPRKHVLGWLSLPLYLLSSRSHQEVVLH